MTTKQKRVTTKRFYADALSDAEASDFPAALEVEGVDQEIALLRLRLRTSLQANPDQAQLMFRGVDLLVKLLAIRYRLTKDEKVQISGAMAAGLRRELASMTKRPADD